MVRAGCTKWISSPGLDSTFYIQHPPASMLNSGWFLPAIRIRASQSCSNSKVASNWRSSTANPPHGAATAQRCAGAASEQCRLQEKAVQKSQWYVFTQALLTVRDICAVWASLSRTVDFCTQDASHAKPSASNAMRRSPPANSVHADSFHAEATRRTSSGDLLRSPPALQSSRGRQEEVGSLRVQGDTS